MVLRKVLAYLRNEAMRVFGPDLVGSIWWRIRGRNLQHFAGERRARFEYMYRTGYWIQGNKGPLSGWGSSLEATRSIRTQLPKLLRDLNATSLLDLGCGDFTWMKEVDLPCAYIGVDIVPALIANLNREYGNERRRFVALDACEEELPSADIVLCREVFFHLSFSDMKKMFANLRRTGARYLIATTNAAVQVNLDIPSGEHTDRNLALPPLSLGEPERTLWDGALAEARALGLWKLR